MLIHFSFFFNYIIIYLSYYNFISFRKSYFIMIKKIKGNNIFYFSIMWIMRIREFNEIEGGNVMFQLLLILELFTET